jgi:hypothetical protein
VLGVLAALWERLTKELAQSSPLDLLIKIVAAVMLAAFVYVGQKLVRRCGAWVSTAFPAWWDCIKKIARARAAVDEPRPWIVANRQAQSTSAEHYRNPVQSKQTHSHHC